MALGTNKVPPVPVSAPIVDDKGMITPAWLDFFQQLLARVGGSAGN